MRVAYLTGRSYKNNSTPIGTVPRLEQVSHRLIASAGVDHGMRFEIRYWDDPSLRADGYDAAVIRTCWDYHERVDEFIAAITALERGGLRVFNSADVVCWNARKTYLRDLGAAAIDTIWTEKADVATIARAFETLDASELVIKPQVGAGSAETVRLKRNAWSEADLHGGPKGAAMIQAFVRSIETEGERSLFWFGGEYSHAIRKTPRSGDWRANIPGQTRFFAEPAPPPAREIAETALGLSPRDLLYVRVDLVFGDDGRWRVIEIEAIEPYLFLDFAPEGADAFVRALSRLLAG